MRALRDHLASGPICAWCGRRIDPDCDVSTDPIPSGAQLSHGICRACIRKFFPEVLPWW